MKTASIFVCSVLPGDSAADPVEAPLLEVSKSVGVDAPVSTVWARCGDFGAIDVWLAAVVKETLTKGEANLPGAVRHLDIGGGGYVNEELDYCSAVDHCYGYRILDGVLPLSDYCSELSAAADGPNKTLVTWSSTFKRKDAGPNPATDANDATALKTITGLYEAGLANLKKVVEQG